MRAESKLISALCKNKDINTVLSADVDNLFVTHYDVWDGVRDYYFRYQSIPDVEIVENKFNDFEGEDVSGETAFYIDELRNEYINGQIEQIMREEAQNHGKIPGSRLLERISVRMSDLEKMTTTVRDLDVTDYEDAISFLERKKERADEMGGSPGIPTGLKVVDTFYPTGFAPGHLIVLIGWSGKGKSWAANMFACKAWDAGFKPMIVSLEMSPEEQRERIYTIMGSGLFRNYDFSRGNVNINDFSTWAKDKLADQHPFTIVSNEGLGRITPSVIKGKVDKYRPDIVFIDYQQLLDDDSGTGNEVQKNRNISRDLKRLAMSSNIPVVNLSQATQDDPSDTDEPPRIEQVAWSKGIQHDANLALAVHKYPSEPGEEATFAIVARKNRHGELFEEELQWDIDRGKIEEIV